jgi:hypothetical protein
VPLPSNADIDRVVAMVGQVWHRFVAAVQQAQNKSSTEADCATQEIWNARHRSP